MKRLNGWQRIGIIASVVWFIVGAVLTIMANEDEHKRTTDHALDRCWVGADKARDERFRKLDERHLPLGPELEAARKSVQDLMDKEFYGCADKVWVDYPSPGFTNVVAFPLITLGVAWILVYFLVGLGRWVGAGFRQASQ
jgi:hypothetical protein